MADQAATAQIHSGKCGFQTSIKALESKAACKLTIQSDCELIQGLAQKLAEVDPFQEISYRGDGPLTLKMAAECRLHPACPVPAGIIKAIEVACGLALPMDAYIKLSK